MIEDTVYGLTTADSSAARLEQGVEVVVGFQRVYFGANHERLLRHITEGFYDVVRARSE